MILGPVSTILMSINSNLRLNCINWGFILSRFDNGKVVKRVVSFVSKSNSSPTKSQSNLGFEFPDLNLVDLGPNFVKIGAEMRILEPRETAAAVCMIFVCASRAHKKAKHFVFI